MLMHLLCVVAEFEVPENATGQTESSVTEESSETNFSRMSANVLLLSVKALSITSAQQWQRRACICSDALL